MKIAIGLPCAGHGWGRGVLGSVEDPRAAPQGARRSPRHPAIARPTRRPGRGRVYGCGSLRVQDACPWDQRSELATHHSFDGYSCNCIARFIVLFCFDQSTWAIAVGTHTAYEKGMSVPLPISSAGTRCASISRRLAGDEIIRSQMATRLAVPTLMPRRSATYLPATVFLPFLGVPRPRGACGKGNNKGA